jgi:hypothetical protein
MLDGLRAGWWGLRAVRSARRSLERGGLDAVELPAPPAISDDRERWVRATLRLTGSRCLVRSIVLQAWRAARGRSCALVIGVTAPGSGFRAHAWLDGDPHGDRGIFTEILRRAP